jgi:hypothetical protein
VRELSGTSDARPSRDRRSSESPSGRVNSTSSVQSGLCTRCRRDPMIRTQSQCAAPLVAHQVGTRRVRLTGRVPADHNEVDIRSIRSNPHAGPSTVAAPNNDQRKGQYERSPQHHVAEAQHPLRIRPREPVVHPRPGAPPRSPVRGVQARISHGNDLSQAGTASRRALGRTSRNQSHRPA